MHPLTPTHAHIHAAGMTTEAFSDYVVGHGELWSAQLMALHCQQLGSDCV